MAPVKNGRYLFNEVPSGYPIPGQTTVYDESEAIDLDTVPLNGGALVKILVVSIDPYLRGRMRRPEAKSGGPSGNRSHSRSANQFQHFEVIDPTKCLVLANKEGLPWSAYVGVAGMPGQTAHHAWKEFAEAKKGDTVFVSSGAGVVGATVVQLAKADGLKVIASAGSDEKVEFMKSIGVDVPFNYKTTKIADVLEKEGPINVYWDNVGGESLEAAIEFAARGARFIECGMISGYNTSEVYPVKNLMKIISKQLHIHGFIVTDLMSKYNPEFYSSFVGRIGRGEIAYKEHLLVGLEPAGDGILDVQKGRNFGKCVIVVGEDKA